MESVKDYEWSYLQPKHCTKQKLLPADAPKGNYL